MDDREYSERTWDDMSLSQQRYYTLKRNHLCTRCKKKDAYTIAGRSLCYECTQKRIAEVREYYWKDATAAREKKRQRYRELSALRREQHQCTRCGKQLSEDYSYSYCAMCRAKNAKFSREARRKKGVLPRDTTVRCYYCNKRPPVAGKFVCEECYEKRKILSINNLKNVNLKNHPWRVKNAAIFHNKIKEVQ